MHRAPGTNDQCAKPELCAVDLVRYRGFVGQRAPLAIIVDAIVSQTTVRGHLAILIPLGPYRKKGLRGRNSVARAWFRHFAENVSA